MDERAKDCALYIFHDAWVGCMGAVPGPPDLIACTAQISLSIYQPCCVPQSLLAAKASLAALTLMS